MQDQLYLDIRKIVAGVLEQDESAISPESHFVDDLGADSMLSLEMLVAIEKKYKVKIPEDRLSSIAKMNDVVELAREFIPN